MAAVQACLIFSGLIILHEKDKTFEIEGISCIMNAAHEMYVYGMEIDWQDGLNNRGFTFKIPMQPPLVAVVPVLESESF